MFNNPLMPKFLNFYISDHKLTSVKSFSRNSERGETFKRLVNNLLQKQRGKKPSSLNSFSVSPNLDQKLYLSQSSDNKCLRFTHLAWTNNRNPFERRETVHASCSYPDGHLGRITYSHYV